MCGASAEALHFDIYMLIFPAIAGKIVPLVRIVTAKMMRRISPE